MRDKKLTTERPLGPRPQEVGPHSPGIEPVLDCSHIRPVGERISQPGARISPLVLSETFQRIADAVLVGRSCSAQGSASVRLPAQREQDVREFIARKPED